MPWYLSQSTMNRARGQQGVLEVDRQVLVEGHPGHQVLVVATQITEGFSALSSVRDRVDNQAGGGLVQTKVLHLIGISLVRGVIALTEEWKCYRLRTRTTML